MSTATIRIIHADGRTEERALAPGSYEIGRESGELVLPDANVSARHARLDVEAARVLVVDLGSSNGTLDSQGRRLTAPHQLEPNQPVRFGSTTLVLVSGPAGFRGGTEAMPQFGAPSHLPSEPGPAYPGAPYGMGGGAAPPGYAPAVGASGYGAPPEAVELRRTADRWMILAIVSVFCGCGLPGIINVVLASQAKTAIAQGDFASARSKLSTVKLLCIIGWCVLAATLLFLIVVYGGLFAALMAGSGGRPPTTF
jgi:hypothetical protein